MKKVLTTIYFAHTEWYPVIDLAPLGKPDQATEKDYHYHRVEGELYSHMAQVPRQVARDYKAAVTSYHAAEKALNEAIEAYYKTLPPRPIPAGGWLGVSSSA